MPSSACSSTNLLSRTPPRPKSFEPNRSLSAFSSASASPNLSPATPPFQRLSDGSCGSTRSLLAHESPYGRCSTFSLGSDYSLPPDISKWGFPLDSKDPDDDLHQPDPNDKPTVILRDGNMISWRGVLNLGTLISLCGTLLALFTVYPIYNHFKSGQQSRLGGFNLGGINASGQVPVMPFSFSLIDPDTPQSAYTKPGWKDSSQSYELVFSDEFNTDGRTFYPGDDPYWEAVDLHYWETNNLEWYDPAAVTTTGGNLVITLEQKLTHDLNYQGGMLSTWNKFCFTGGYVEANVSLPGLSNVQGLWPAIWTMGNLGRAGYGASLEGMWPYTYDACDVGTVANQTVNGQPVAATINGDPGNGDVLSFLPGQRLSRCTCPNSNDGGQLNHPGPKHSDGTFVGRAAPEIDMFEAQIEASTLMGQVSQSAQFAPFNAGYIWLNTSENEIIPNPSLSKQNTFIGSATQQATSVITYTDQNCYEGNTGCFSVYGFEYAPGFDDAYITWVSNNAVSWALNVAGVGPDPETQISARPIPQEPMYIIANLGMSHNFGPIDFANLPFPVHLKIDYIRVYQPSDSKNIGCNPPDFPTEDYINTYLEAYTNANLTTWRDDFGKTFPGNSFLGQCSS
ncbi:beta-glucan synthesis-associated [Abortiporus biennis]|nr:beta-glucan synthesis-associated [Abortiporus biennis]